MKNVSVTTRTSIRNMNTMTKYITAVIIALTMFSCDDFLDKRPIDQITADDYFVDGASSESAVLGLYRSMASSFYYGQAMLIIPEFAAGHVNNVSNYPEYVNFETNNIRIDNPWTTNIWTTSYSIINAANNVIAKVPDVPANTITEEKRAQLIREAKFIRALNYFNLVRSWGDVPLVLTPTPATATISDLQVSRTATAEVYAQIISDLREASELPLAYGTLEQTKGRATRKAAKALLAKVYLYRGSIGLPDAPNMADFTESAALAYEVLNGGDTLTTDFASIWRTKNTGESLFELQFDVQATNSLATTTSPTNSNIFLAKDKILNLYTAEDKRKAITVFQQNNKTYIGKYPNYNPAIQNTPLIRMAEVYLIYAEAQARITGTVAGEPYRYFKAVRDRAGLTTPDASTYTSVDEFITEVQREKRLELMFEGEAWYDYTRTRLALTEMMTVPDAGRFLFPVPQSERDLNINLSQNQAYL